MKAGESEGERRAPQAQVECQNELHKFMGQGCHARSEPVLVLFFSRPVSVYVCPTTHCADISVFLHDFMCGHAALPM